MQTPLSTSKLGLQLAAAERKGASTHNFPRKDKEGLNE